MKNFAILILRVAIFGALLVGLNVIAKLVYLENLESGIYTSLTDSSGARLLASTMITSSVMVLLIIEETLAYFGKVFTFIKKFNVLNLIYVTVIASIGLIADLLLISVGADWSDPDHLRTALAAFGVAGVVGFMVAMQVLQLRSLFTLLQPRGRILARELPPA